MIKKAIGLLVLLALAIACLSVVVTYGARVGAAAGLLVGALSGSLRIVGVDFRQWFRDPGTPSEIRDNSWIGLMRGAFHALGFVALLSFFALVWAIQVKLPAQCAVFEPGALMTLLPNWLIVFLHSCSGFPAVLKIIGGGIVGAIVMHGVIEFVWRQGLKVGFPGGFPADDYLAPSSVPLLRPRIPRPDGFRRIIVCCDGTWNWPDGKRETNIVRLVRAIKPDDGGVSQIVHYHQGVGTGNFVDRLVGGGAGVGLSASVKACYGFIADNYKEGDEILLFGFSRGAYIARALGGLIGRIGLMRKHEMDRFGEVWNWYWQKKKDRHLADLDALAPHRLRDVEIECIGVWDTVGALGIPGSRFCASQFAFHETGLGLHVRNAFQALATDERRGNFQAAVWVPYAPDRRVPADAGRAVAVDGQPQVVEQAWFPGVHSNIGGGYLRHGLSDTTFLWMLSQLHDRGLLGLNQDCIVRALDPVASEAYPHGKMQNSRTLFWRLVGSPIPRPVCVISDTERVHEAASDRSKCDTNDVPASDIYKQEPRMKWLATIGLHSLLLARTAYEKAIAAIQRPDPPQPSRVKPALDLCSRVMSIIGVRG